MKTKYIVAAIASALALGAALPASADDYRGSYNSGYNGGFQHQDWRGRDRNMGQITVRTQNGQFTVGRGDRLFNRLTDRPYRFRAGFTYVYTDRCNRDGCMVLELRGHDRRPSDRFFAPYIRERIAFSRDDQWRGDNNAFRGNDRDQRGQFDRRSDSRDFRDDGSQNDLDNGRGPPPQGNGQNGNGRFDGNGYQGRNNNLLGGPH